MLKSRCRFLVPTHYNDGKPVEPEVIVWIRTKLNAFDGYRIIAPQEGYWEGQVENTHEFEVAVFPRRVPELRQIVIEIGKRLGQIKMFFDVAPPSVSIIDVETGEDDEDEDE